jgi:hypothetical protein
LTPRERVIRALEFDTPDRAPRDLWMLPRVEKERAADVAALVRKYPLDLFPLPDCYGRSLRARGTVGQLGSYVDEWGCEFSVLERGIVGEVKNPPLADWANLDGWSPPWELLDGADTRKADCACKATDKFVRAGTHVRPFERMQFLRGTENLYINLLTRPPELERLRALIHEFNLRDIEMWTKTAADAIFFMDDWGSQNGLLIDPRAWREFFKPMYKEYCDLIKGAGKKVMFHSDGHIFDIYEDLIDIGVDAVNSQLFCMDIEDIARRFKGRITFWGEISRQMTLPFGTPDDVRAAVRRVRNALDGGVGGVLAQCEWGIDDPIKNIETVYESWLEPLPAMRR